MKYKGISWSYSRLKETKETRQVNTIHNLGSSFAIKDIIETNCELVFYGSHNKLPKT